jgi:beta-lactamase regulating signal transducer with metallopeptidase domain
VAESAPAIDVDYELVPIEEVLTEIDQPEVRVQTVASSTVRRIDVKVVIVVAWLVGVLLTLARLVVGWYRLGRICCSAMPAHQDKRFGDLVHRKLQILVSSGVNGPVCFGLIRPTIVLPRRTYEGSSGEQLQMVLNHELAHIERKDCLANFLQRIVEAVFFFHPLVWWFSFQLTQEREQICDNYVVAQGASATDYTALLAQIVEQGFVRRRLATVALLEGGLLQRARRLVDPRGSRKTKLSICVALLCTTVALTCFTAFGSVRLTAKSGVGKSSIPDEAKDPSASPYKVTLPEQWKPYLSVGELTVVGSPFYGVTQPRLPMQPLVRINWSMKNLTSETLDVKVNYRSNMMNAIWGNTGFGVWYTLAANEDRRIDNILPVVSARKPVRFGIRMVKLRATGETELDTRHDGVLTEWLPVQQLDPDNVEIKQKQAPHFLLKSTKLRYSEEQGSVFVVEITNKKEHELPLGVYVVAGDPNFFDAGLTRGMGRDVGPLAKTIARVPAQATVEVKVPYVIPEVGPNPLAAFTLFEPSEKWLAADDYDRGSTKHRIEPFCWGWYDLRSAQVRGEAKLPVYEPVEERAKLTGEKASEHFLFRYRPGSYTERNIDTAIRERETAYANLSSLLEMELPEIVTIDLYPDMEAKGLGSGTPGTPCNTRTDKHICEVYSQTEQCPVYHELAHIFSYHFPDYDSKGGWILESFAVYFEMDNTNVDEIKESLKRKLNEGQLRSLGEILLRDVNTNEQAVLIDFLLKKDAGKFKKFFVSVTEAKGTGDLEKASQAIYHTNLNDLQEQWRQFLRKSENVQGTTQKRREQNE